jgi:lectin, mannose-binding 2
MTLLRRIILGVLLLATIVAGQQGGSGSEAGNAEEGTGQKSVPLRTHSLYPPYLDLDLQSRWYIFIVMSTHYRWEFGGTTVVDTNKFVAAMISLNIQASAFDV